MLCDQFKYYTDLLKFFFFPLENTYVFRSKSKFHTRTIFWSFDHLDKLGYQLLLTHDEIEQHVF